MQMYHIWGFIFNNLFIVPCLKDSLENVNYNAKFK